MADEITVEGGKYVSSKRASESTGYSQDYIGQLARKNLVDSRRIGGLWYVSMDSLAAYKERSDASKAKPTYAPSGASQQVDAIVSFDGKDYISAARAAQLTGYHQDYVGQLARGGKVLSRQVGTRWYVEREGVLSHKKEKDSLLAAVQAESVGLVRPHGSLIGRSEKIARSALYDAAGPHFTYTSESGDLMPVLTAASPGERADEHKVPIRILENKSKTTERITRNNHVSQPKSRWATGFSWVSAAAATIVIVLSVGYISVANSAQYAKIEAVSNQSASALVSGASEALSRLLNGIENLIAPEMLYERSF